MLAKIRCQIEYIVMSLPASKLQYQLGSTSLCSSVEGSSSSRWNQNDRQWFHPQEGCISHGRWHAACHCEYSLALVPDVGFCAQHTLWPAHTEGLTHSQPPTMPCNMSDQWHRHDPVGNKGYEVWQQCARWSPSSCLFLQAMGSQTEEWKSDPYIDSGGGKFVGPSGILMNRKSASGFLQVQKKDSSPPVDVEDVIWK